MPKSLFGTLEVDRFPVEYDDDALVLLSLCAWLPKGKTVVLGLVSSKVPRMEDADVLAKRIEEASKYVPLENLALSPQCGFAATAERVANPLSEDQQWSKLNSRPRRPCECRTHTADSAQISRERYFDAYSIRLQALGILHAPGP